MSTEKKYYNEFLKEITEQQVLHLDKYITHFIIDGKLKKAERILKGKTFGKYYLDSNESLQDKIQELCVNKTPLRKVCNFAQ